MAKLTLGSGAVERAFASAIWAGVWLVGCGSSNSSGPTLSNSDIGSAGVSAESQAGSAAQAGSSVAAAAASGSGGHAMVVSAAGSRAGGSGSASNAGSGAVATAGVGGANPNAGDITLPSGGAGAGGAADTAGEGGAGGATEETCDMMVPSSMDCSAKLAPGDERTCMLGTRKYIVYAGKTLNLCKPTALIIDAHGASETAEQQAGEMEFCAGTVCWHGLGSGWKAEADTPGGGFIVAFPQGLNNMWQQTDADFMTNIVTEVEKIANIDPKHVYISGISNGGFLTYWTGCPHSDVFHGMAPNAGGADCSSLKAPIPVIQFDDDPDFALQSSVSALNTVVTLNNCKGKESPWITVDKNYTEAVCRSMKEDTMATLVPCNEVQGDIEPTVCTQWDQCDGGVKVVMCKVAANTEHGASNAALDGHIIYENNTILNTPSLAWRFFKQFW